MLLEAEVDTGLCVTSAQTELLRALLQKLSHQTFRLLQMRIAIENTLMHEAHSTAHFGLLTI